MKKTAAFAFLFLLISTISFAQTFPQPQDKYVNDFAGFLDSASISELRNVLSSLEQNTTAEVVVVAVQTTEPLVPSQYRTELFNNWHIGKKGTDNGLLILYAVKEKRIEVEVGYGLEGILPDSKVGRILDEFYVPYRDKNETTKGIVLATEEFARVIESDSAGNSNNSSNTPPLDGVFFFGVLYLIIIIFAILVIYALYRRFRPLKCPHDGTELTYLYADGAFDVYTCEHGHRIRKKRSINRYTRHITFGGSGFGGGGGGGGGGFGGGGSGGGGAGR